MDKRNKQVGFSTLSLVINRFYYVSFCIISKKKKQMSLIFNNKEMQIQKRNKHIRYILFYGNSLYFS